MRLWSLHPKYLDTKGLTALWREALLARAVLQGKTKGYRHHPQLIRFKRHPYPRRAIAAYLLTVHDESLRRGHEFKLPKVALRGPVVPLPVTEGQLRYETQHLLSKLRQRDPSRFEELKSVRRMIANPLFHAVPGPIESWERVKRS